MKVSKKKPITVHYVLPMLLLGAVLCFCPVRAEAARLKDIASIEGVRGNQLIGYGLVVGLQGTGDKKGSVFTSQAVANLLERLGTRVNAVDLKLANTAGVMVTAELPPFARPGGKIDVTLSSLGNAKTLQGGVLLLTPLRAPDGQIYAAAQGPVSIGGFVIKGGSDSVQQNHTTVGRIAGGATVERTIPFDLFAKGQIRIMLKDPDFNTVTRIREKINSVIGKRVAKAMDSGSVVLPLTPELARDPIQLIAKLEHVEVRPDTKAKVVVNERTGTVIIGEDVRVATVALAHGNLNISISSNTQVSQPQGLSQGQTVAQRNQDVTVGQEEGKLNIVEHSVSLGDVVNGLNALGATPRDLIAIFQALKRAGALQADLVIM